MIDFRNSLKGNLHTHTNRTDGEFTVEEVTKLYQKNGYAFIAITDHRVYYNKITENCDIQILAGCEYNCYLELDGSYQFHLLTLKIKASENEIDHNDSSSYNKQFFSTVDEVQQLINTLRNRGNIVLIAHPLSPYIPIEILKQLDFDGFEVFNTKANSEASEYYNELYQINKKLLIIASDDSHHLHKDEALQFYRSYIRVAHGNIYKNIFEGKYYASTGLEIMKLDVMHHKLIAKVSESCLAKVIEVNSTGINESYKEVTEELIIPIAKDTDAIRVEFSKNDQKAWTCFYEVKNGKIF